GNDCWTRYWPSSWVSGAPVRIVTAAGIIGKRCKCVQREPACRKARPGRSWLLLLVEDFRAPHAERDQIAGKGSLNLGENRAEQRGGGLACRVGDVARVILRAKRLNLCQRAAEIDVEVNFVHLHIRHDYPPKATS